MIKLTDRISERKVYVKKDKIESLETNSYGDEVYTHVVMESGTYHDVKESVASIVEMDDKD